MHHSFIQLAFQTNPATAPVRSSAYVWLSENKANQQRRSLMAIKHLKWMYIVHNHDSWYNTESCINILRLCLWKMLNDKKKSQ